MQKSMKSSDKRRRKETYEKHWVDLKNVGKINAHSMDACNGRKRHHGVSSRCACAVISR
jgi:hypothetical protein